MSTRRLPFRKKPNDIIQSRIEAVVNGGHKLFLMQELGPTLFIVREEYEEERSPPQVDQQVSTAANNNESNGNAITKTQKYKVAIGNMQKCTCGSSDICIHILFIMLKVLRVPKTNPVIWQHSLLEREINDCLSGRYRTADQSRRPTVRDYLKRSSKSSCDDDNNNNNAKRRQVEEGDTCPVCLDDLTNEDKELTYCKSGCGKQAHIKCMIMYAEHQKSVGKKVTCPLCRSDWGSMVLYDLKSELVAGNNASNHPKVRCCHCPSRTELHGTNYRCLVCADYDLCPRCFRSTAVHAQHPFVQRESPHHSWKPAPRVPRRDTISSQRRRLQQASSSSSSSTSSSLVRQIQHIQQYREFNSNDYELLLRLDEENRREQRRLNALTNTNDLYEDDAAVRVPLAIYLIQCIKACYTTFNNRTRATLNYNLPNMTNSVTCVQCNGRMSGTSNPVRLICGDWVHGTCVETLISSSIVNITSSTRTNNATDDHHDNSNNRTMSNQVKYPSCPKCKQCLYPGLKPRYKKKKKNDRKKKNKNKSDSQLLLSSNTGEMNNNNFIIEATGIHASNNNDNNSSINSLIQSNCRIHSQNKQSKRRPYQNTRTYGKRRNNSITINSMDNNNLSLNVSSQKSISTSIAKRGGKIHTINNFNNRRKGSRQSLVGLRRSHSAGTNSAVTQSCIENVENYKDAANDGESTLVLQTISLGSSLPTNNVDNNKNNNDRRLIASSSGQSRSSRLKISKNRANRMPNLRQDVLSGSGIRFGGGILNALISSNGNVQNNNNSVKRVNKRANGKVFRGLTFRRT